MAETDSKPVSKTYRDDRPKMLIMISIFISLIGILLLAISYFGEQKIVTEWESENIYGGRPPCEVAESTLNIPFYWRDEGMTTCNSLEKVQSLWFPGWTILSLGIMVGISSQFLQPPLKNSEVET